MNHNINDQLQKNDFAIFIKDLIKTYDNKTFPINKISFNIPKGQAVAILGRNGAGKTTLINDEAHVYKGGSWSDRAYWLSPGTRRFLQASHTSSTIGFRCCMDRLGSPSLKGPSGNRFTGSKKKGR